MAELFPVPEIAAGTTEIVVSDWLDAPIERVTGGEASPSISKVLERAAIARREEVATSLRQIAGS